MIHIYAQIDAQVLSNGSTPADLIIKFKQLDQTRSWKRHQCQHNIYIYRYRKRERERERYSIINK